LHTYHDHLTPSRWRFLAARALSKFFRQGTEISGKSIEKGCSARDERQSQTADSGMRISAASFKVGSLRHFQRAPFPFPFVLAHTDEATLPFWPKAQQGAGTTPTDKPYLPLISDPAPPRAPSAQE